MTFDKIPFKHEDMEVDLRHFSRGKDRFLYIGGFKDLGQYTDMKCHIINEIPKDYMNILMSYVIDKGKENKTFDVYMESQVEIERDGVMVQDPWLNEIRSLIYCGFSVARGFRAKNYLKLRDKPGQRKDIFLKSDGSLDEMVLPEQSEHSHLVSGYTPLISQRMTNVILRYAIPDVHLHH